MKLLWCGLLGLLLLGVAPSAATAQSVLSGTVSNPDGSGFNGRLVFSLAQNASASTLSPCTGPALIVSGESVMVTVSNGSLVSPPTLTSSSCTIPVGIPYNVTAIDSNGNVAFTDQWLISGNPFNVGTAVSSGTAPVVSYQGPWQSTQTYSVGDIVSYGSGPLLIYISVVSNNVGNVPASSTADWQVLNGTGILGVSSVNSLQGALSITGDSSIDVTPSGADIALSVTGSLPGRTIDCAAYSTLALCWAAAQAYVTTNETGSGHAVIVLLHDQSYTRCSGGCVVYSGMQVEGVQPRLAAGSSHIWQSPTLNGGTVIDCGGGQCFTGGNSAGLTGVVLRNFAMTDFTTAGAVFGGSGVNGLSNSTIQQVYCVGPVTYNSTTPADTCVKEYNGNFLQIYGLYGYNLNTVFSFYNLSPVGLISGNSNIYDVYAYTYAKSATNGNNAEPGILLSGVNLVNMYRPQVNTYAGDGTGDAIELTAADNNHLYDTDTEGSGTLLNGVRITGSSVGNTVYEAIGTGASVADFFVVDAGSTNNTGYSTNANSGYTFNGSAVGNNFFHGPGFIVNGETGLTFDHAYGNTVLVGNGTVGDWTGALGLKTLNFSSGGVITGASSIGEIAVTTLNWGAYSTNLMALQKDSFVTTDYAFEPLNVNTVDLGGYNQGWRHGFLEHLDQALEGGNPQYAGQCTVAGTPATTCTITIQHAYTYGSLCFASPYGPYTGTGQASCNLSGTTITITTPAAIATSLGWNAFVVGNPF